MRNRLTQKLASAIASSATEDQLYRAMSSAALRLGFDHFALAYDRRGTGEPASLLIHDYPEPWARLYVKLDLGGVDPVRRAGERSMTGFGWRDLDQFIPLTKGDRKMLEVGREHGVGDGFTVPRHLPGEASGACSFATRPQRPMPADMFHAAEIVGAVALTTARRLLGVPRPKVRPRLSERQRECLLWIARGKTASETAAILGISEETVIQHLKVARDRYDVHCRQMLILCALFDGLIGFSDIYDWWHD